MGPCQIVPSSEVDSQIVMALTMLTAFIPRSLRVLYVEQLTRDTAAPDDAKNLAEWLQESGYREATLSVAPELSNESADTILQVLRHELVHGHLHQLDVFVKALIAACPGNRPRNATTEVYYMLRESVADDISYAVGDVVEDERERQKMACPFKMAKEQAIW